MLYNPNHEKDNCGFGLITHIDGLASHKVIRTAIYGLSRMQHRGAILGDGKTGDGCGLLLQKPARFFQLIAQEQNWRLAQNYAVGMFFLSQDSEIAAACRAVVEEELLRETLSIVGWRQVPIDQQVLGEIALASLPTIEQVFINAPAGWNDIDLERRLYMARRRIEKRITDKTFYACSLSNQVIVYKGLCMPKDLSRFYLDLADLRMETAICLFHQRFSTNTMPRWQLAQPFRHLAHNGEINTITGNRQWARARAYKFKTPLIPDLQEAAPFVNEAGSDSSSLDNMLELFLVGGMDMLRAMRLLIPPAWQNDPDMSEDLQAFFDFNSMHMEPWDGPAGVVLSDGRYAACGLDRNGLRPARYVITSDRLITCASEVGIWDYQPDEVVEKGRVGPGELLVIDTQTGRLLRSHETDNELQMRHPYQYWLQKNVQHLSSIETIPDELMGESTLSEEALMRYQVQFGYAQEERDILIKSLASIGEDAVGAMGDDTPLAILSTRPRLIYDYFRQKFAQVTNPGIDALRESHVMSLVTHIGREMNVFAEAEGQAHRLSCDSPILLYAEYQQLLAMDQQYYRADVLDMTFDAASILDDAIVQLCLQAEEKVRQGTVLLILSDRHISANRLPIPAPLAVAAVQKHLVAKNLRCDANLIVETGSTRDPHHFAVLLSFGATAIYPYLAYETVAQLVASKVIEQTYRQAMTHYREGVNRSLCHIMSKMGISTVASYRGSQLFEIVGIHQKVIDCCFDQVKSVLSGATFADFQQELMQLAEQAWQGNVNALPEAGLLTYHVEGEYHAWHPQVVQALQQAIQRGQIEDYQRYANLVNQRPVTALRDLLALRVDKTQALPLDEVEPESAIFKRFETAAMSLGSLSPEAHESLAIAMNTLGGYANAGEGGEDPSRHGTMKMSRVKQVGSGRFGVTPDYLVNADIIQIKVAQGAKPGDGGYLPGCKVSPYIAQLRCSVPGVTLISPPPHHDIYSIEDLAQLIFDLKQINPRALISVKLVAEAGIGTIATGIAKAYADAITISGYDGGAAASVWTSVKHAGAPWELGLVEVQQALVSNGLRHKMRLQVDGGMKTGLDVIKAAILGAESFAFGTAPIIALGCQYSRQCHQDRCAAGMTTQDAHFRHQYHGRPEQVMTYFRFVAQEVRHWLAQLGVNSLQALIGRTDLLTLVNSHVEKQQHLQLSPLLEIVDVAAGQAIYATENNPPFDQGQLNQALLQAAQTSIHRGITTQIRMAIQNTDRAVGASLAGLIAQTYGEMGMRHANLQITLTGTAGQSFGVWNTEGMQLTLIGDANDYVGKGMAGGQIVIHPPVGVAFKSHCATIMGNTCLYGATGGRLFAAGCAGERFAVRNSGAISVVEGVGDHGCEYMTRGVVCVLGQTGINFGAGMTGGLAYVWHDKGEFTRRLNLNDVEYLPVSAQSADVQAYLHELVTQHAQLTGSARAKQLLANWPKSLTKFLLVKPKGRDIQTLFHENVTMHRLVNFLTE